MTVGTGAIRKKTRARGTAAGKPRGRGDAALSVEFLIVSFKDHRTVLADGNPIGVTNHMLMLPAGGYDITLDGGGTSPADIPVDLLKTSIVRPRLVAFN